MKNFSVPIENHIYRRVYQGSCNCYYAIYLNGKFYTIINEPHYVLFRAIVKPSIEVRYIDGTTFDNDYGLSTIVIEDMGEVQPRWKRLLTFGRCGWVK